ncbi:unnamed protein product [Owenia fusiformis]|uniref:Uncharacterized protein n=1 Tax=Owenia fusiformis TaxID=6347 RepID=A0A8J1T4Q9_OWEFU|nr:unnamed protein product [Owenia fusiformis]
MAKQFACNYLLAVTWIIYTIDFVNCQDVLAPGAPTVNSLQSNLKYFTLDEDVTLYFQINGQPKPRCRYHKGGVPVQYSENIFLENDGNNLQLISANEESEGIYHVTCVNKYGIAISDSVHLKMARINLYHTIEETQVMVLAGDKLTLPCKSPESVPDTVLHWEWATPTGRLTSTEIVETENHGMDQEGNFRFLMAQYQDGFISTRHLYACVATNTVLNTRVASGFYNVTVIGGTPYCDHNSGFYGNITTGSCYSGVSKADNMDTAIATCARSKAVLVMPKTQMDRYFLHEIMNVGISTRVFVGMRSIIIDSNTKYTWFDGTPFTERVVQTSEVLLDCIVYDIVRKQFVDQPCERETDVICQTHLKTDIEDFPTEMYYSTESPIVALEGESLDLQCMCAGSRGVESRWTTPTHQDYEVKPPFSRVLHFESVRQIHEGNYTCDCIELVEDESGEIMEELKMKTSATYQVIVESAPKLRNLLRNQFVLEGYDAVFNCDAYSNPRALITWLVNGKVFKQNNFTSTTDSCWTCSDASSNEQCQEEGELVLCIEGLKCSCETEIRYDSVRLRINKRAKQTEACLNNMAGNDQGCYGNSKNLFCYFCCVGEINGRQCNEYLPDNLPARFQELIPAEDTASMSVNIPTMPSQVTFPKVNKEFDIRTVQCNVSNIHGYVLSTAALYVAERSTIKITPESTYLRQNTQTTLKCKVTHDPVLEVDIQWFIEDYPVGGNDGEMKPDGSLVIYNPNNWGVYKCQARTELEVLNATAKVKKAVELDCQDGYTPFPPGQSYICVKLYNESSSWRDALATCQQDFSHLAFLSSSEVSSAVGQYLVYSNISAAWIGMHVDDLNRIVWEEKYRIQYTTPRNLVGWYFPPGQPNTKSGKCGAITGVKTTSIEFKDFSEDSGWPNVRKKRQSEEDESRDGLKIELQSCEKSLPFICMNRPIEIRLEKTPLCEEGWLGHYLSDKCYYIGDNVRSNFSTARDSCRTMKSELMMPKSHMDMRFATAAVAEVSFQLGDDWVAWVGLVPRVNGSFGEFDWLDGEPLTGSIPFGEDYDCVWLDTNGDLNVRPCRATRATICEKPRRSKGPSRFTESPNGDIVIDITNKDFPIITCEIDQYYFPDIPVFLGSKNMGYLPMTGYPRAEFSFLEYAESMQQQQMFIPITKLQGDYWCEAWSLSPVDRIISRTFTITDKGTLTYVGSMKVRGHQFDAVEAEMVQLIPDYNSIYKRILTTTTYGIAGNGINIDMKLNGIRNGSVIIDFNVFYKLDGQPSFSEIDISQTPKDDVPEAVRVALKEQLRSFYTDLTQNDMDVDPETLELMNTASCARLSGRMPGGRNYTIPATNLGKESYSLEICVQDGRSLAKATCEGSAETGTRWSNVMYYNAIYGAECIEVDTSPVTKDLETISIEPVNIDNVEDIVEETKNLTSIPDILTFPDVIYTSMILEHVAQELDTSEETTVNFVKIVNNILGVNKSKILEAQILANASNRIVTALDQHAANVNLGIKPFTRYIEPNIALEVWDTQGLSNTPRGIKSTTNGNLTDYDVITVYGEDDLEDEDIDAAIILPIKKILPDLDLISQRLSFAVYQKNDLFVTPKNKENLEKRLNSHVISAAIDGVVVENLEKPIKIIFKPLQKNKFTASCVYYEYTMNDNKGGWSNRGMEMTDMQDGQYMCTSDHLTNFAVLMDFSEEAISEIDQLVLGIISKIGLSISIAGLGFVVLTFIFFKKMRKARSQKVLFNLALALLCSNLVFLFGIEQTSNYIACLAIAALLHYFIMVTFAWMLVEGIVQYLNFVKVMGTYIPRFMRKTVFPCWLVPLVPVIVVLAVDYNLYRGGDPYCWMALYPFYFAFLIPIGVIIIINLIIFTLVLKGITCDRQTSGLRVNKSRNDMRLLEFNAAFAVFVVLGLTWVFGFFAINEARIIFQYLFCIFNSIQGFLIFVFHCIREKHVRDMWYACCCPKKRGEKKYHSVTGSTANSKTDQSKDTRTSNISSTGSHHVDIPRKGNSISDGPLYDNQSQGSDTHQAQHYENPAYNLDANKNGLQKNII